MPNESESLLYHLEPFCLPDNEGILPSAQSVVLIVCFAALGPLPILIDRGQVVQDVLDWLSFQKDKGKSSSTLYRYALALSRFCDFWKWYGSQAIPQKPILTAFFEDLVHGKRELGWKGIGVDYAKVHIEIIGLFLDWFVDIKKLDGHPNPLIEEAQSFGRLLEECSRRFKNDFLFHLMPTTKRASTHKRRKIQPHLRAMRGGAPNATRPKKTFLFENFITVVKFERSIRNLLLWLLLGAGGLRLCEALHIFISDISQDAETGEARILLADPTYGKIQVPPGNTQKKLSRQEYLKEKFGLVPRDQLPLNDLQFVGWKGMKFHHPETKTADVVWLHPLFGRLFWELHKRYLKIRKDAHPKHPYYFVNLKQNIGEPLTATNAKQLFADLCARLNLRPPYNVHSLRHMYVDVLVNRLKLTVHQAQILVRHRSPQSTEVYAEASAEATRRALQNLSGMLRGVSPDLLPDESEGGWL